MKSRYILIFFIFLIILEGFLRVSGTIYLNTLYVQKDKYLDDSINIVALGESTTAGLFVEGDESYPGQLKAMLREKYPDQKIRVVVPPHVGQNTGQISNRIENYIELYDPKFVIIMAGYNNEWSLAESNIAEFLTGVDKIKASLYIRLDGFRIFRVIRYCYLRVVERSNHVESLGNTKYIWGGPQLVRYPPKQWVYSLSLRNEEAFRELWRHDIKNIIRTIKKNDIPVILMTYHINPSYLPAREFVKIAEKDGVKLIRNDLSFQPFIESGDIKEYVLPVDNWHPNQKGYEIIARNVFNEIT